MTRKNKFDNQVLQIVKMHPRNITFFQETKNVTILKI